MEPLDLLRRRRCHRFDGDNDCDPLTTRNNAKAEYPQPPAKEARKSGSRDRVEDFKKLAIAICCVCLLLFGLLLNIAYGRWNKSDINARTSQKLQQARAQQQEVTRTETARQDHHKHDDKKLRYKVASGDCSRYLRDNVLLPMESAKDIESLSPQQELLLGMGIRLYNGNGNPKWTIRRDRAGVEIFVVEYPSSTAAESNLRLSDMKWLSIQCNSQCNEKGSASWNESTFTYSIILCDNNLSSGVDLEHVLTHELIHAYDEWRGLVKSRCDHLAYSELRAYRANCVTADNPVLCTVDRAHAAVQKNLLHENDRALPCILAVLKKAFTTNVPFRKNPAQVLVTVEDKVIDDVYDLYANNV